MADDTQRIARAVGGMRIAAGAMLLLAPRIAAGRDPAGRLLARVTGIRDVVLGAGQAWAATQDDAMRLAWMRAGTASDVADIVVSLGSRRSIGTLKAVGAAGLAVPFVAAGVLHEAQSRS